MNDIYILENRLPVLARPDRVGTCEQPPSRPHADVLPEPCFERDVRLVQAHSYQHLLLSGFAAYTCVLCSKLMYPQRDAIHTYPTSICAQE